MKPSLLGLSVLASLVLGCASTGGASNGDASADSDAQAGGDDDSLEITKLERKLMLGRERLGVTRMEHEASERQLVVRIRHAKIEVEIAEAELAKFSDADAPNRLEREKLNLQAAHDRAQEAADELAQIEIMYEEQDIDDVTAEFVVSRGRRRAARAAAQIELQEREFAALSKRELPDKERALALALDRALEALIKLESEGAIATVEATIEIKESEGELQDLERELAEKKEDA